MAKEKKLFSDSEEEEDKEFKPSKKVAESTEDEESSGDELKSKPIKKKSTQEKRKREEEEVARDSNGNQYFELSNKRRVTIRAFSNGEASVDIREVYLDKNSGEMRPGKSGICMPMAQWNKLKELLPDIEEAIAALPNKKK